jgi:glycosyltransferase involved in cell wall biosynthesis
MAIGVFFAARMRVLHVISGIDPENGGPSMALHGLARAQLGEGMDAEVVATWQRPTIPNVARRWRADGIPIRLVGPARGRLSRHPDIDANLNELIDRADVIHIHALWEEIQHRAARIAAQLGRPYLIRPCGGLHPWSLAHGAWRKRAYLFWRLRENLDRASAIHYTSEDERRSSEPLHLCAPPIVEPNGVDLAEFSRLPARGAFRRQHGIEHDAPLVLFLGRIDPKKGLDILVRAFGSLGVSGARLVLAGPDSDGYAAAIRDEAKRLSVDEKVVFTGMVDRPQRLQALVDADLFVMCSYTENFGVAVIESLAAGLPVIVSDQVAIHDAVSAGGVGEVVPVDSEALARAMRRWLDNASLRQEAGRRAPEFVRTRYDWRAIARAWRGHYQSLIDAAIAVDGV